MAQRWLDRWGRDPEPRPPVPKPANEQDALAVLTEGEVLSCELIPWGSNYTYLVALGRQGAPECLAVYKPRRGEAPLWDFPDGTLYRRERAAYLTARALGWNIVPLTIIRDGPHGIGSVQLFVETADLPGRRELTPAQRQQLACIALFDLITNNADRKGGHCLVAVDGHIWGIDHGLTFHQQAKLRTVLYEFYREPIPPPFLRDLRALLGDAARRDTLQAQLGELLARAEVRAFFARTEQIATSGRYPPLDYYRRPWPFV